jgi:diguanylate cyclase (GGDEF)-like protein
MLQWSDEYKDKLTGLWRRDVLFDYLDDKIKEKQKQPLSDKDKRFCVILFDLDHFKWLNDRYGHLFGDKVIKVVASSVSEGCAKKYHEDSFVVRYGGDEMVAILDKVDPGTAEKFATALLDDMTNNPLFAHIEDLDVTASAGMSVYPDDATDSKKLFELADKALYLSKKFRANKVIPAKKAIFVNMLRRIRLLFYFIAFLIFLGFIIYFSFTTIFHKSLAGPVSVELKFGGSMQGKIVYQDNEKIILELMDGKSRMPVSKSRIKRIKRLPSETEGQQ